MINGKKILAHSQDTYSYWIDTWVFNATINYEDIRYKRSIGELISLEEVPKVPNKHALVAASGPSLDRLKDFAVLIKNYRKNLIIVTGPTNALSFYAYDIDVDFIVAIDSNPIVAEQIKEVNTFLVNNRKCRRPVLVTTPLIDNGVLKNFDHKVAIFKPVQNNSQFSQNVLPVMFSDRTDTNDGRSRMFTEWFKVGILNSGCVANAEIAIAHYLSCNCIFLLGVDFCYKDDKASAHLCSYDKENNRIIHEEPRKIISVYQALEVDGKSTTELMVQDKIGFDILYRVLLPNVYTLSDHSLIGDYIGKIKNVELFEKAVKKIHPDINKNKDALIEHIDSVLYMEGIEIVPSGRPNEFRLRAFDLSERTNIEVDEAGVQQAEEDKEKQVRIKKGKEKRKETKITDVLIAASLGILAMSLLLILILRVFTG